MTGAVVYVRPTFRTSHGAGATVLVTHRQVAGLYSTALAQSNAKKNWKPHALHKVVDDNGYIDPAWNRFFSDLANRKLGGPIFPTLPDLTGYITTAQAQTLFQSLITTALEQQVNANAQSQAATVQVVQNAGLTGAASIPPVVLARQETNIPPAGDPFGGAGAGGGD
jgi:hypothetical protein